jgi:signal transduction histidine kinase
VSPKRFLTSKVEITIADSGRGIQPEILPQLMRRGFTFGKAYGNGLGLYHAKTTLERWQGEIHIDSQWGVGTTARLILLGSAN